jgi:hypothetical protein
MLLHKLLRPNVAHANWSHADDLRGAYAHLQFVMNIHTLTELNCLLSLQIESGCLYMCMACFVIFAKGKIGMPEQGSQSKEPHANLVEMQYNISASKYVDEYLNISG